MPDIQTAFNNALGNQLTNKLKNTINDWEKDDMQTTQNATQTATQGKRLFDITNNVTRATFNFIKKNPNQTSPEICLCMERLGYKSSSVGSLLAQFAKQGLAERDDRGRYITIVDEYRPLKAKKKTLTLIPKPEEVKVKRKYEKKATGIAALQSDTADAASLVIPKRITTIIRARTPEDILKDMTVYQARELYVHLHEMFGG
jgi:hypothetical protein